MYTGASNRTILARVPSLRSHRIHFQSCEELRRNLPSLDQLMGSVYNRQTRSTFVLPYRLNLTSMTTELTSHFTGLHIEYDYGPIDLSMIASISIQRSRNFNFHTLPEARRSPLRLNLRQVACPDPKRK